MKDGKGFKAEKTSYIGNRFTRLTVMRRADNDGKHLRYVCRCDCGTIKVVHKESLRCGASKSCGCLSRERCKTLAKMFLATHSKSESKVYSIWSGMKRRCSVEADPAYKNYGGRGIKVCERWMEFKNFYEDMGDPPINTSLDRIDNQGDYEPSNCRWRSRKDQANNRRSNRLITYRGQTKTMAQWANDPICASIGLSEDNLYTRIKAGWKVEDVFSPLRVNQFR